MFYIVPINELGDRLKELRVSSEPWSYHRHGSHHDIRNSDDVLAIDLEFGCEAHAWEAIANMFPEYHP